MEQERESCSMMIRTACDILGYLEGIKQPYIWHVICSVNRLSSVFLDLHESANFTFKCEMGWYFLVYVSYILLVGCILACNPSFQ